MGGWASKVATSVAVGTYGGHEYELFKLTKESDGRLSSVNWNSAQARAAAMSPPDGCYLPPGVTPHLASITSADENTFITNLLTTGGVTVGTFIGCYQLPDTPETTSAEKAEHWLWDSGECFYEPNGDPDVCCPTEGTPVYANWNYGEPNDYGSEEDGCEMFNTGLWNDLPLSDSKRSYFVVEYPCDGYPEPLPTCSIGDDPDGVDCVGDCYEMKGFLWSLFLPEDCDCYKLTPEMCRKSGSIWYNYNLPKTGIPVSTENSIESTAYMRFSQG